jgi:selenocysteine-specific elongation factor
MKQVILGTAGHIDHGKTSLIKALTGIDTDRLKEEKLRGITIELGFAYLKLPGDELLGIVDVPGHERFVKQMVAGATGIDLVALVIAADEGVMPQTREHMEICQLLRVKKGLVVLTKIDLLDDPEWLELVRDDVSEFLRGSFLEGAPMIAVSAVTGEGLEELKTELVHLVADVEPKSTAGAFRLPVDRVFSMKGFGTVVTGTSISGHLRVGDTAIIYPSGLKTKVRGLQVHNQDVQEVLPGQRTAINLQSLERGLIQRGDVVATAASMVPSYMIDVHLDLLPSTPRPLKHRAKVRFHTGTAEHLATVVLLDRDEMKPGDASFVQLRFDTPIAVLRGDRYVLRSYSPIRTIGGGTILHPLPRKHKGRAKLEMVQALPVLLDGEDADIILWHIADAGVTGLSEEELQVRANVSGKSFQKILQQFISQKKVIPYDKENRRLLHPDACNELQQIILTALSDYHQRFALKAGMAKEELAAQLPHQVEAKLYNFILQQLSQQGSIATEKEWIRLVSHTIDLAQDQQTLRQQIEKAYRDGGLQPPFFKEVAATLPGKPGQQQEVLQWMFSQGILVKVKEDLYFHAAVIAELQTKLAAFLREHGEVSTAQFKDLTQASRKYTIPLLEYFDTQRVTIRVGDTRRLREVKAGG